MWQAHRANNQRQAEAALTSREGDVSSLTAYLGLAICPVAVHLIPNPVEFRWSFRHGLAPMPRDVAERAERIEHRRLFLIHVLIAALVLLFMRQQRVAAQQVGLHLQRWKTQLAIGFAAGFSWNVLIGLAYILPAARQSLLRHRFGKGPAAYWALLFLLGAFSEEFWRAFSLFALANTGHSALLSVVLTAVAFGAAHSGLGVFGALGAGFFGTAAALLFLWSRSLPATYLAHLIVDLGALYRVRRATARRIL